MRREDVVKYIESGDVDYALAAAHRIESYEAPTTGEWAAVRLAAEVRTLRSRVAELEPIEQRAHEMAAQIDRPHFDPYHYILTGREET